MARVQPMLGDRAKLALKVSADWDSKPLRKLLVLLAAYRDAGERQPLAVDLAARLKIEIETLDKMLGQLAAGGWIWVVRRRQRRSTYVLRFCGDQVPERDLPRFANWERQRLERRDERERVPA
jgi:hypothetical protein